jgi:hypothetical protein
MSRAKRKPRLVPNPPNQGPHYTGLFESWRHIMNWYKPCAYDDAHQLDQRRQIARRIKNKVIGTASPTEPATLNAFCSCEAIKRRNPREETLAEIGCSYAVSGVSSWKDYQRDILQCLVK